MLNLSKLQRDEQAAHARRASALQEAERERAHGNHFRADCLEMDARNDAEDIESIEKKLAAIQASTDLILRFERETGHEFDAIGPLPTACTTCGVLYQHVFQHTCQGNS